MVIPLIIYTPTCKSLTGHRWKNVQHSKSVIIKECGHVPMMEKPEETASIYQDFLKGEK